MLREVDDMAYLQYLRSDMYRNRYLRWKDEMLEDLDAIIEDLDKYSVDEVMDKRGLTPKDIALLVRLRYLTDDEVARYDLRRIEQTVPA